MRRDRSNYMTSIKTNFVIAKEANVYETINRRSFCRAFKPMV